MLQALPLAPDGLPGGVYWVSGAEPDAPIAGWLQSRDAVWVKNQDFDELMVLIKDEVGLPHPDEKRFEKLFARYAKAYDSILTRIGRRPDSRRGLGLESGSEAR